MTRTIARIRTGALLTALTAGALVGATVTSSPAGAVTSDLPSHLATFNRVTAPAVDILTRTDQLTRAEARSELLAVGRHACAVARNGNSVAGYDPLADLRGSYRADRVSTIVVNAAARSLCPRLLVQVNVDEDHASAWDARYLRSAGWYGAPDDGGEYLYR
jgi:hypothetical protein